MPCPSQMIEDEEEGDQVELSKADWLPTSALLELFPAVANGNQSKRMRRFCRWTAVRGAYL